jgi:hypothetical protein
MQSPDDDGFETDLVRYDNEARSSNLSTRVGEVSGDQGFSFNSLGSGPSCLNVACNRRSDCLNVVPRNLEGTSIAIAERSMYMQRRHGDTIFYIVNEGFVDITGGLGDFNAFSLPIGDAVAPEPARSKPAFRYGRMFRDDRLSALDLGNATERDRMLEGMADLGLAMHGNSTAASPGPGDHPSLPAGFTFLGQFIAHDISFDKTANIRSRELTRDEIMSGRSPSLDLDSVYGLGPDSEDDRRLYEDDRASFKIGKTSKTSLGNAFFERENDLVRDKDNPDNPRLAVIADVRNDDNLAVAQTHVAFLKFHNAVVERLKKSGVSSDKLFEEARTKVVQHYQSIVLHDFLPRIVDEAVLDDVVKNGPRHFKIEPKEDLFMPIEFSFAAFRWGHSTVRDTYQWNRVFQTPKTDFTDIADLGDLFKFTGLLGNLGRFETLPTNWIIDWSRFYNIKGSADITVNPKFNHARTIYTSNARRTLAFLNLRSGLFLKLPSGQTLAEKVKEIGAKRLSGEKLSDGPHFDILKRHGFDEQTPLWYYILKEAEIFNRGERLGPLGSLIVAETLVALIRASRYSILGGESEWHPDLDPSDSKHYSMADLLAFADVVNPLGN